MRKLLLFSALAILGCVQIAWGATSSTLIDMNYSSYSNWTIGKNDTITLGNYSMVCTDVSNLSSSRSKNGFTGAAKCSGVEISTLPSVGSTSFTFQNGAGSTVGNFKLQVSTDNGVTWITTDSVDVAGNGTITYTAVTNAISKSSVRMRLLFPFATWFYGCKITSSDIDDGVPGVKSSMPSDRSVLASSAIVSITYDELIKVGTGIPFFENVTNASIDSSYIIGNTLYISEKGFNSDGILTIPSTYVTDLDGNAMSSDYKISFVSDHNPPVFQNITPANNSTIHIQDLGESTRYIVLKYNEPIKLATDASSSIYFNGIYGTGIGKNVAVSSVTAVDSSIVIRYAGLSYNTKYNLVVPNGAVMDMSSNLGASVENLVYFTGDRDATAPTLMSQSVSDKAVAQPITNGMSFTFDEKVVVANQTATVNGKSVKLSNNGKVIGLNYSEVPYASDIVVSIPEGAVTDTCGNAYTGISFTISTVSKTTSAFDAVVDGSIDASANGVYKTVQEALNAAPGTSRFKIFVKNGIYKEKLVVEKDNISLIGQDPDKTIFTYGECSSTSTLQNGTYATGIANTGTDASYSMLIVGNNFYGENFTIRNDYDYQAGSGVDANRQAVALEHINGDKSVLKNVKMFSFQDTYYPKSENIREYLKNCTIQGGTDFIFGSGSCYIDSSYIKCVETGQHITACSGTSKEFGVVFNACNVTKADTVIYDNTSDATAKNNSHKFFDLGRNWKDYAHTSYINCKFDDGLILPAGWSVMSGDTLTAVYHEYNNTLISDGSALNVSNRVGWSSQLTSSEAARYDYDNAFNYGAGNVWNPMESCLEPVKVSNAVYSGTGILSWDESTFAAGYIILKNGEYLTSTVSTSYTDNSFDSNAIYSVIAYNAYGATSNAVVAVATSVNNSTVKHGFLQSTFVSDKIFLKNPESFKYVSVIDGNGKVIFNSIVNGNVVNADSLPQGIFVVKGIATDNTIYTDKIIKK